MLYFNLAMIYHKRMQTLKLQKDLRDIRQKKEEVSNRKLFDLNFDLKWPFRSQKCKHRCELGKMPLKWSPSRGWRNSKTRQFQSETHQLWLGLLQTLKNFLKHFPKIFWRYFTKEKSLYRKRPWTSNEAKNFCINSIFLYYTESHSFLTIKYKV